MHVPWRNDQFVRNGILRSLSPEDFEHVRPFLQSVLLKERSVLQEPNRRVEYVHFIETGLVSLMTLVSGSALETAIVGSLGFDPASIALGASASAHRSVVLVKGNALRIHVDDLRSLMNERPQIREHLLRYVYSLMVRCSQLALCGVRHHLEPRLASWLCLAGDALDDQVLPITQDHLSIILGFRRVGLSQALKRFEEEGMIRKYRGVMEIRDRSLLEQKACCCYEIVTKACAATTPSRIDQIESRSER